MPMAAPTPASDRARVRRPGPPSAPAQPARPPAGFPAAGLCPRHRRGHEPQRPGDGQPGRGQHPGRRLVQRGQPAGQQRPEHEQQLVEDGVQGVGGLQPRALADQRDPQDPHRRPQRRGGGPGGRGQADRGRDRRRARPGDGDHADQGGREHRGHRRQAPALAKAVDQPAPDRRQQPAGQGDGRRGGPGLGERAGLGLHEQDHAERPGRVGQAPEQGGGQERPGVGAPQDGHIGGAHDVDPTASTRSSGMAFMPQTRVSARRSHAD